MLQALRNFLKPKLPAQTHADPAQEVATVETVTTSRDVTKDAITYPLETVPWCDELFKRRSRDPELGIAVAAKVSAWRLHAQMGMLQFIPMDYRAHLLKAVTSDDFELQSMIYSLIQTNIMRNYPSVIAVKML